MRLVLIAVVAACGGSTPPPAPTTPTTKLAADAPTCDVVQRAMRDRLEAGVPAEERETSLAMFDEAMEQDFKPCTTRPYAPALRTCLRDSATSTPFGSEDDSAFKRATAVCHRTDIEARGNDMGGPDCEAVLAHMKSVSEELKLDAATIESIQHELAMACIPLTRASKECLLGTRDSEKFSGCLELTPFE